MRQERPAMNPKKLELALRLGNKTEPLFMSLTGKEGIPERRNSMGTENVKDPRVSADSVADSECLPDCCDCCCCDTEDECRGDE
jgi:hypothetical protein